MSDKNSLTITGYLGNDPKLYTSKKSGTPICTFHLAINYRNREVKKTSWHLVQVWGARGKACARYLTKGRAVIIDGRLDNLNFKDAQGKDRQITIIVAKDVTFLNNRVSRENQEEQRVNEIFEQVPPPSEEQQEMVEQKENLSIDEELPF